MLRWWQRGGMFTVIIRPVGPTLPQRREVPHIFALSGELGASSEPCHCSWRMFIGLLLAIHVPRVTPLVSGLFFNLAHDILHYFSVLLRPRFFFGYMKSTLFCLISPASSSSTFPPILSRNLGGQWPGTLHQSRKAAGRRVRR